MGKKYRTRNSPRNQKKYDEMQEIAKTRILFLFNEAGRVFPTNQTLAHRYIFHVRRLSMATKTPIPIQQKRYICHGCKHLLVPGTNMRFRFYRKKHYGSYLSVVCLDCNHITRYLYKGPACRKYRISPQSTQKNFPNPVV
jgi:RNase P subunit RPR2